MSFFSLFVFCMSFESWVIAANRKEMKNSNTEEFFGWGFAKPKAGNMSNILWVSKPPSLHVFHLCVCVFCECEGVHLHFGTPCMCWILEHGKSQQRCTSVAALHRLSDMPVMDEIVGDFKVAESSSESASVFRQARSGLPDKPLKTLNPVNSQCKSVCCSVLIHN